MQLQDHSIAWLQAARRLFKPTSIVIANIKNSQHHQYIQQLLSQNSHNYTTVKFGNVAKLSLMEGIKVFLDAGMLPHLNGSLPQVAEDAFIDQLTGRIKPTWACKSASQKPALNQLQYIFTAKSCCPSVYKILKPMPCSVLCATNNALQYQNNLAVSPDLLTGRHPTSIACPLPTPPTSLRLLQKASNIATHMDDIGTPRCVFATRLAGGYSARLARSRTKTGPSHRRGWRGRYGYKMQAGNFDFAGCAMDRIYTFPPFCRLNSQRKHTL
jgi:hypothetical protein